MAHLYLEAKTEEIALSTGHIHHSSEKGELAGTNNRCESFCSQIQHHYYKEPYFVTKFDINEMMSVIIMSKKRKEYFLNSTTTHWPSIESWVMSFNAYFLKQMLEVKYFSV